MQGMVKKQSGSGIAFRITWNIEAQAHARQAPECNLPLQVSAVFTRCQYGFQYFDFDPPTLMIT